MTDPTWFDYDDVLLFEVDDLDLRAKALQHSLLPRLRLVLNESIAILSSVYGIDVFEDSHVQESPNFRKKSESVVTADYQWATVGLSGKRARGKWRGFSRKNGAPVQIVPFKYEIGFTKSGLGLRLHNYWMTGLSDDSYRKLLDFHLQFADNVHTLCYRAGLAPLLHWGRGCASFTSFTEHYRWMRENRRFDNDFYSRPIPPPIDTQSIWDAIFAYIVFFPVYDSYLRIAKGQAIRLGELLDSLNQWYVRRDPLWIPDDTAFIPSSAELIDEDFISAAREIAAQRVSVMPSLRFQVFRRDGFRCVACGRRGGDDGVVLHVDHIVPRSKGGQDSFTNLQTLCSKCNLGKGDQDDTDLRRNA